MVFAMLLHLVLEAQLSRVALTRHDGIVPTVLWAMIGPLPDGVNVEPPNPVAALDPRTGKPVVHKDCLMHDLAYEEFLELKRARSAVRIWEDESGTEWFSGMISVKRFAVSIGYDVRLYETCDY